MKTPIVSGELELTLVVLSEHMATFGYDTGTYSNILVQIPRPIWEIKKPTTITVEVRGLVT